MGGSGRRARGTRGSGARGCVAVQGARARGLGWKVRVGARSRARLRVGATITGLEVMTEEVRVRGGARVRGLISWVEGGAGVRWVTEGGRAVGDVCV